MKKITLLALMAAALFSCNKKDETVKTATYKVDESVSKIEWRGEAPDHFHIGSFKVNGNLTATQHGEIQGGDFTIPIASIDDYDLEEPTKSMLLNHLKSDDFFKMVTHPTASFHITKVSPYVSNSEADITGANHLVTGDFTMLGKTLPISFPAKMTPSTTGVTTEAKFNIDRTKWGMNSYTDPTQQLYILPEVKMHLTIYAAK